MKQILVFLDNFDTGGVTSVVQTIYRNINQNEYHMDFARRKCNINEFDTEIETNGNKIYYYIDCGLNNIPILNYKHRQLYIARQIISQVRRAGKKYDAIHIHANPIIGLFIGKKLRIPIRIMHTHEAIPDFGENIKTSKVMALIWKHRKKVYNKWATVKAGDSKKACLAKFGDAVLFDSKMKILHPPIDMERFCVSNYDVEETQENFHLDETCFNMIHVGRLTHVKNQKFLIDILDVIQSQKPSHLYIVGDGELKEELISYAEIKGVSSKLTVLPANTSPALYRMMDCSLLPSFSEAFGMVAVESQIMNVPCFVSTNVPEDVDIGICSFLNLNLGANYWCEQILSYDYDACKVDDKLKEKFNVLNLVKELQSLYNGERL